MINFTNKHGKKHISFEEYINQYNEQHATDYDIGNFEFFADAISGEAETLMSYVQTDDIGFEDAEEQSDSYFKSEPQYPAEVTLYRLHFPDEEICYMVSQANRCFACSDEVYESIADAEKCYAENVGSGYPSIDSLIKSCSDKLGTDFSIEAKREYNNGGHYVSYNIYYDGMLVVDGAFSLNDELVSECALIKEMLDTEFDNGIKINKVEKVKGNPSWEKYYVITFSKDGYYDLRKEYSLAGWGQGIPRNINDFINSAIDFDNVLENMELEYD